MRLIMSFLDILIWKCIWVTKEWLPCWILYNGCWNLYQLSVYCWYFKIPRIMWSFWNGMTVLRDIEMACMVTYGYIEVTIMYWYSLVMSDGLVAVYFYSGLGIYTQLLLVWLPFLNLCWYMVVIFKLLRWFIWNLME